MSQTGTESTPISSAGSPAQGAKSGDQAASPQKANQTLAERLLGAYKQMLISLFSATLAIIAAIALLTLLPYAKSGTGPSILVLVVLAGGIVWLWVVANNGLSASTGADPAGTFAFFILLVLVAGGVGLWRGRR